MKSLVSIVESVLDKSAGLDEKYIEILETLNPLYKTWINKCNKEVYGRKYSLYEVAKPTAIQVAKKMVKNLQGAGTYDYKDYKQFSERNKVEINPNGYNLLASGKGIVLFEGKNANQLDAIVVYGMHDGKQHMYSAEFKDEGVRVVCVNQYTAKPNVADARAQFAFEIPGDIAEKIITAGIIS